MYILSLQMKMSKVFDSIFNFIRSHNRQSIIFQLTIFIIIVSLVLLFSCRNEEPDLTPKQINDCNNFDVILVAGQSNTMSGSGIDTTLDKTYPDLKQLGRFGQDNYKIIDAREPLQHYDNINSNSIGFAMIFGREYLKNGLLEPGRQLLIIPCGKSGTGFHSGFWNRGNDLYNDAVIRVKSVLQSGHGNKLVAILWHQGENDVGYNKYQSWLDKMILDMRNDINSSQIIPFITGGMVPLWVSLDYTRIQQQKIIANTQYRISSVGYADPTFPFSIEDSNFKDTIHYSAKGQREMGKRYFYVFSQLIRK
jgi:hypothetical protein